jgi:hypothetical protein
MTIVKSAEGIQYPDLRDSAWPLIGFNPNNIINPGGLELDLERA